MLMLSAGRRDEVREMRWDEINAAGDLWTLPASRNKSGRDSSRSRCLGMHGRVVGAAPAASDSFVFTVNHDGPWQSHGKFKSANSTSRAA